MSLLVYKQTGFRKLYSLISANVFNYVSLPNTLSAVLLLFIFMQVRITHAGTAKIITKISAYAFGVYLLQCHGFVWGFLCTRKEQFFPHDSPLVLVKTAGLIVFLFAAGVCADWLRAKLFSLLKIGPLCKKITRGY